MNIGILGAGLSGVSLAYLLQERERVAAVELLEQDDQPGGLCRSYPLGNVQCDLGPHILFSKNAAVLECMIDVLGENVHKLRRSNRIFHDGRFVKYPFENDLAALSETDKQYCLDFFLQNPYGGYTPQNMLQFFLGTFGEGITNLFLRPYNEKIWKFDPAFMDTQMVDRIPKPPAEDILRSAQGVATEGYVHQLYFYYPKSGGIESLVRGFRDRLGPKTSVQLRARVERIERCAGAWCVYTADGASRRYDRLVSTIPIPALTRALGPAVPQEVAAAAQALRFNSLALCTLRFRRDHLGANFAVMVADKKILFHRLSKLNFLLPPEANDGTTTLQAEVAYRAGDPISRLSDGEILQRVSGDLARLGFVDPSEAPLAQQLQRCEYAYVIYDLDHRRNIQAVRDFCEGQLGIVLHGRFGEFEYLNMDGVLERSLRRHETFDQWSRPAAG